MIVPKGFITDALGACDIADDVLNLLDAVVFISGNDNSQSNISRIFILNKNSNLVRNSQLISFISALSLVRIPPNEVFHFLNLNLRLHQLHNQI
jgi:hypothetical protein